MNTELSPVSQDTSDGYHTFRELYEHRHALFLLLMRHATHAGAKVWVEEDPATPDWFLAGIDGGGGFQVSYHMPNRLLPAAQRYTTLGYQRRPYDGYTSDDVLRRLQEWAGISPEQGAS